MTEEDSTQPTAEIKRASSFLDRLKDKFSLEKIKNANKQRLVIYGLVGLVLISAIGFGIWKTTNNNQQTSVEPWRINPKYAPEEVVTKIGEETIYGEDLNYLYYNNFNKDYYESTFSQDEIKKILTERIASESAIIQAASAENIIKVDQTQLTALQKDHLARQKLINDVHKYFEEKSAKVSGSVITIWYYNSLKPSIPEAEAKRTAQLKIRDLRTKILTGEITFEEAGQAIREDTSLERLDQNYKGNASFKFKGMDKDHLPFTFDNLNSQIWGMKVGEISPILNVESFTDPKFPEKFYAVIRLDELTNTGEQSFNEWYQQKAKSYLN